MDYNDRNAHRLMPDELVKALPDVYSQEDVEDPIVHAKYFTPDAGATWFIIERDHTGKIGEEPGDTLFCFACLGPHMADCAELGYVTLSELRALRGPMRLQVERDLYFKPKPLSQATFRRTTTTRTFTSR